MIETESSKNSAQSGKVPSITLSPCESHISLKSGENISVSDSVSSLEDSKNLGSLSKKDTLRPKSPSLHSIEVKAKETKSEEKIIEVNEKPENDKRSRRKGTNRRQKLKTSSPAISFLIILLAVFAACITMVGYQMMREEDPHRIDLLKTIENTTESTLPEFECFTFKGDGFCDDEANNEFCDFDEGDCCDPQSDRSQCSECFCKIEYFQTKKYMDCPQINMINGDLSAALHGDGNCDKDFNIYEEFFDAGDCCLPNPKIHYDGDYISVTGVLLPIFVNPPRPCQENECVCIPNNLVCNATQLGDGKCQDYNNGPLCDYDLGDCCLRFFPSGIDECCICKCHLGDAHFCPEYGDYIFWFC